MILSVIVSEVRPNLALHRINFCTEMLSSIYCEAICYTVENALLVFGDQISAWNGPRFSQQFVGVQKLLDIRKSRLQMGYKK